MSYQLLPDESYSNASSANAYQLTPDDNSSNTSANAYQLTPDDNSSNTSSANAYQLTPDDNSSNTSANAYQLTPDDNSSNASSANAYQLVPDENSSNASSANAYQLVPDENSSNASSANSYQIIPDEGTPSTAKNVYQPMKLNPVHKPEPKKPSEFDEFSDEETESPEFLGITRLTAGSIKLSRKLGQGAFGLVYKGQWGKRPVAMKTIDMEHAKHLPNMTDENINESLSWEVSRLASVNHPNCVQFYGIYQNKIRCRSYIVMEFCAGGTLQRKLETTTNIKWDLRWQWSYEMSKGLNYLHQQGVLHRDLKAENVLLDVYGTAKLADLGVAQVDSLLEETEAQVVSDGLQDKRFIAPENLQNPASTKMTDIYALGFIFWQMTTEGEIPRHPNELLTTEKKEWRTDPNYIREKITEDCPEIYKQLIVSCWALDPGKRPKIEAVIETLSGMQLHEQAALIKAIQKLEELLHTKSLEGVSYIAPYLTNSQVKESIDQYWAKLEAEIKTDESTTKLKEEKSDKGQSLLFFDYPDSILPPKLSNPPLTLKGIFEEFLYDQTTSTLLLFGDSGLGKSLSAHLLAHNLLYNLKESLHENVNPLPPFSRLPLLIRPALASWSHKELIDGFTKALNFYGLEMKHLEKIPLLLIVDGYDECVLDLIPQNIWVTLNVPRHLDIKVLITCRPNTILQTDVESRFKNNKNLKVNYFLSFNMTQLLNYLKNYFSWDENTLKKYREEFSNADQLRSVLRNPFVLSLMAQSWETVTQNIRNLNSLDRWHIYEGFVNHWIKTKRSLLFENVQKKLSLSNTQITETNGNEDLLLESFQRFAGEVAFRSFLEGEISLSQEKIKHNLMKSEWFDIDSLIQKESEEFFNNRNSGGRRSLLSLNDYIEIKRAHLNQFQTMSPIKCRSDTYEFSHKSFFEFFAAKYILLLCKEKDKISIVTKGLDLLKKRSLREQPEILKFWIEGFNKPEQDVLVQPLFDIIKHSRENPNLEKAPSNAATLLASARISFSGRDLSGVNIPDADLSGAILHHTSFKDAHLERVLLIGTFLGNTNFSGAKMKGISFGLYPKLEFVSRISCVAFSPDGQTLASGGDDNIVRLQDVRSQKLLAELKGHTNFVTTVSFSPDGQTLVSGSYDKTVRFWNVKNHSSLAVLSDHTDCVLSVSFSPDGKTLASGSRDKTVQLWDVESQKPLAKLEGHTHYVASVSFSPDGKTLASGSWDKTIRLFDVESQKLLAELKGHNDNVTSVSFSPDGKILASGSRDTVVQLWDVENQKSMAELYGHIHWVSSVSFSPDGKTLASGSDDSTVRLWNVESQKPLAELKGHKSEVTSISFSPDGKTLASGGDDKTVRFWVVENQKPLAELKGHAEGVWSISFSPDGKTLASAGLDKTVQLWDVENQKPLAVLKGYTDKIRSVSFSPDGKTLASGSWDKIVQLWDVESQKLLAKLEGHTDYINNVSFSPDGKTIASGSVDKTVRLWDVESQKPLAELDGHKDIVNSTSFSPDGKILASGSCDKTIRLWDVESQKLLAELDGHTADVNSVSFSPDGKMLASGSWDKTIRLWDVESRMPLAELKGHTGDVNSVSFSPDGKTLASGGIDKILRLWDVESQKCLAELHGHTSHVCGVEFSPDGKTLASGSEDKSVRLWDVENIRFYSDENCEETKWHPTLKFRFTTSLEFYAVNCLKTEHISKKNKLLLEQQEEVNKIPDKSTDENPQEGGDNCIVQ